MKSFDIYSEGYAATGQFGKAHLEGTADGECFRDACINLLGNKLDKNDAGEYITSIWGCRLFDNFEDAQKSFG